MPVVAISEAGWRPEVHSSGPPACMSLSSRDRSKAVQCDAKRRKKLMRPGNLQSWHEDWEQAKSKIAFTLLHPSND